MKLWYPTFHRRKKEVHITLPIVFLKTFCRNLFAFLVSAGAFVSCFDMDPNMLIYNQHISSPVPRELVSGWFFCCMFSFKIGLQTER